MARWRRGTTEESATVPGQRVDPALPPDAGADETGLTGTDESRAVPTAEQTRPDQEPVTERPGEQPGTGAEAPVRPATPPDHKIRHTRLSGTWATVVLSAIILVLLLIFILQNGHTVDVSYLGAHGHLPLGVALLFAAVAGIMLTAIAGSARIMQLRSTARKHRRRETRAARQAAKAGQ